MTFLHALQDLPLVHMSALLLLAVLLGGLIGWERESRERPAGLRTHALVCLGAALITIVDRAGSGSGGRIAAQIVTGVGFLGAGTIIRDNTGPGAVRGLTTAASVWAIAGVGIAVGYGGVFAQLAAVGTLIVLFTLTVLNRAEALLNGTRRRQSLTLVLRDDEGPLLDAVSRLLDLLHGRRVKTRDLQLTRSADSLVARLELSLPRGMARDALEGLFTSDRAILHFGWQD